MEKKQFVKDLREKDIPVNSIFYVARKEIKKTRQNRDYIFLTLRDKTGEVSGFLFENVEQFKDIFSEENYVYVEGVTSEYNRGINLRVKSIEKVDEGDVDIGDFIQEPIIDSDDLFNELLDFLTENVRNIYIKELIAKVLSNPEIVKGLKTGPAAVKMHHALRGGLLEHILSMLKLGKKILEHYYNFPTEVGISLNGDLLFAGILLHDLGKIWEISSKASGYSFSDEGKLLGHIPMGYSLVEREIEKISGFPEEFRLCLLHMILSHHGEREYGSPVTPRTPEAIVLHYIDNMDAKLYSIFSSRSGIKGDKWSTGQNALRKEVFLGCSEEENHNLSFSDDENAPF